MKIVRKDITAITEKKHNITLVTVKNGKKEYMFGVAGEINSRQQLKEEICRFFQILKWYNF